MNSQVTVCIATNPVCHEAKLNLSRVREGWQGCDHNEWSKAEIRDIISLLLSQKIRSQIVIFLFLTYSCVTRASMGAAISSKPAVQAEDHGKNKAVFPESFPLTNMVFSQEEWQENQSTAEFLQKLDFWFCARWLQYAHIHTYIRSETHLLLVL